MKKAVIALGLLTSLCGCSDLKPSDVMNPSLVDLNPIQRQYLDQVLAECPGLMRHSQDWALGSTTLAEGPIQQVEIVMGSAFKTMPNETKAFDEHCYFMLNETANGSVSVTKRACVYACRGRAQDLQPSGVFPLN